MDTQLTVGALAALLALALIARDAGAFRNLRARITRRLRR